MSEARGRRGPHPQARLRRAQSPGNQGDYRCAVSWENRDKSWRARLGRNVSDADDTSERKPDQPLKRGWTTGTCATAATRAAYEALVTGECPDPVEVQLPNGARVSFAVAGFATFDARAPAP